MVYEITSVLYQLEHSLQGNNSPMLSWYTLNRLNFVQESYPQLFPCLELNQSIKQNKNVFLNSVRGNCSLCLFMLIAGNLSNSYVNIIFTTLLKKLKGGNGYWQVDQGNSFLHVNGSLSPIVVHSLILSVLDPACLVQIQPKLLRIGLYAKTLCKAFMKV